MAFLNLRKAYVNIRTLNERSVLNVPMGSLCSESTTAVIKHFCLSPRLFMKEELQHIL